LCDRCNGKPHPAEYVDGMAPRTDIVSRCDVNSCYSKRFYMMRAHARALEIEMNTRPSPDVAEVVDIEAYIRSLKYDHSKRWSSADVEIIVAGNLRTFAHLTSHSSGVVKVVDAARAMEYINDHVHAFIDSDEIDTLMSFDEWKALAAHDRKQVPADSAVLCPMGVGREVKENYRQNKPYMLACEHFTEGFIGWYRGVYGSAEAEANGWDWYIEGLPKHLEEVEVIKVCECVDHDGKPALDTHAKPADSAETGEGEVVEAARAMEYIDDHVHAFIGIMQA